MFEVGEVDLYVETVGYVIEYVKDYYLVIGISIAYIYDDIEDYYTLGCCYYETVFVTDVE